MTSKVRPIQKSIDEALVEIEGYAKAAADTMRMCLKEANVEAYVHFLDCMYHYTRHSGDKCKAAARNAKTSHLKKFFEEFHDEEHWHYKAARDDVETFGRTVSKESPMIIKAFDNFWDSLADRHNNGYLGALYVFENIAKYLQDDLKEFVERLGLSEKEFTWLGLHAEEDLDHGDMIYQVLTKHIGENPSVAVAAARQASNLWSGIMLYAFDNYKIAA